VGALTAILLNLLFPMETPMIVPAPTSKGLPIHQEPSFIRQGDDDDLTPPMQEAMSKYDSSVHANKDSPTGAVVV
jgi:hypothetical protein